MITKFRTIQCFWFKTCFLLALIAWPVLYVAAVEFEVEGNMIYDLYSGRYLIDSRTNLFSVSVRGAEWEIVTWQYDSSNRLECAKDTNCMRTMVADFKGGTNAIQTWSNMGLVEQREQPSLKDQFLQTLWLTYCSSTYLESITNGKIEPIWQLDDPQLNNDGFKLSAEWRLNTLPPNLPINLFYLNDGIYRGYDITKNQSIQIKLQPPYNVGYTCAVFSATSFTNLNGVSIPTEFTFRTSQTPFGNRTPDMPRDVMFGEVRSVSVNHSIKEFLPAYQGEVSIHDFCIVEQFPKGTFPNRSVLYKGYSGDWPNGERLNSLIYKYIRNIALKTYANERALANQNLASQNHRRHAILFFLILTIFSPILLLTKKFSFRTRDNKKRSGDL